MLPFDQYFAVAPKERGGMDLTATTAVVCGGASGLGLATARRLSAAGARVVIVDLPNSAGFEVAASLAGEALFSPADVTDEDQLAAAFEAATRDERPLRAVVHTAGRGGPQRILDRDGNPASLGLFADVVQLNVVGTFNVLRLAATRIARAEPADGERGAIVLTSSVAAFEGQIGQIGYASSKAAIVGMTLCAARDLSSRMIRVCTIAPGIFDTPLMGNVSEDARARLAGSVPHPRRLGEPEEYAALAAHVLQNRYLNGATIRLDGAIRMAPA